jgi:outer membrane protein OmpA-like peptidoglycan-associated protein
MRSRFLTVIALGSTLALSGACASKGFVQKQVAGVDEKVESMSKTLEDTQQRTRANEQRIEAVNKAAEQSGVWAKNAEGTANAATKAATAADARAAAVETSTKRLLYEVTLSEDQGNFKSGSAVLPEAAMARIDQLIGQLKADPKGAYLEVEGHTDNVGDKALNQRLGLERAEAVKTYLHDKYQIPLFKISVISYGQDKPIAPNNTRAGRAQNRRVVIRILT